MTESNSKVIANAMQSRNQITTSTFILKANKKHGFRYDYTYVAYVKLKMPVKIVCKLHGIFIQRADVHLRGGGCPLCSGNKRNTKQDFINKSIGVHGEKYDYSKVKYVNNSGKVEIVCAKHGVFLQAPAAHFMGRGCPLCANERVAENQNLGLIGFLEKAKKKHGERYDYSKVEYVHCKKEIIIICKKHGEYKQKPYLHLNGNHCYACAKDSRIIKVRDTTELFILKAKKVHGERYIYDRVNYKSIRELVEIKCEDHGYYLQKPKDHLNGAGCRKCASQLIGFTRSKYIKQSKKHGGVARLYVIECFGNKEEFVKVGITMTRVNQRYSNFSYKYKIVHEIKGEAGFIWDLEKKLHSLMKNFSYTPLIYFGGYTECFTELPKEIDNFLTKLKKSDQLQLIA